ncbi:MAG TPA: DNA polymerase I [Thermodesulfobacteriota bacterium]
MATRRTLALIDGHAYIYRAFHAIQSLSNSRGFPTNAVFGFHSMIQKVLSDIRPDAAVVCLDAGDSGRVTAYADYKANRAPMADDLSVQIPKILALLEGWRLPTLAIEGYEADDVIGTLARKAVDAGYDVVIVSSDKDMLQLVGPHVRVFEGMKGVLMAEPEVEAKFGVAPAQVPDVLGLAGDAIDNIPGVPGIGMKGAAELIRKYGDLENLLAHVDEVSGPKRRESLKANAETARLSRELARIRTDLPIDCDLEAFARREPDAPALAALYRELEFGRALRDLLEKHPELAESPPPAGPARPPHAGNGAAVGAALPAVASDADAGRPFGFARTAEDLERLAADIRAAGAVALYALIDRDDAVRGTIVGLALHPAGHPARYVPLRHEGALGSAAPGQASQGDLAAHLGPVLADPATRVLAAELKPVLLALGRLGLPAPAGPRDDLSLASYLLDPGKRHDLDHLAADHLSVARSRPDLGSGARALPLAQLPEDRARDVACESAVLVTRLAARLLPRLEPEGLAGLYRDLEVPLVPVLVKMERAGIAVDLSLLGQLSKEIAAELERITREIYELAGQRFSIGSPIQLRTVLFETLKLPVIKRTKTGPSTDADVLRQLAALHPLPAKILEHRTLDKLRSTYVDALPLLVDPETGRIHTTFNQTVAETGRLSSDSPNLQNIPIRTELGRRIRSAFIAPPGHRLVSVDYSQIELRILAHLSQDPLLLEAYREAKDIHVRTACQLFDVMPSEVTPDQRRQAKTVNFAVIYGIGPFSLANDLGIEVKDAQALITRYFETYAGVRRYREQALAEARATGFVTTLFGRKRYVPDLNSDNRNVRAYAERVALNTPIQGSAADFIKRAMLVVDRRLAEERLASRLLLQVHDELLFEAPEAEVERVGALAKAAMEGVASLTVPLVAEVGVGRTWAEAH